MTDSLLTQGRRVEEQVTNDTGFPKQKYYMKILFLLLARVLKGLYFVYARKSKLFLLSIEAKESSFCKEGLLTSLISTIVDIHKGNPRAAVVCTHSISCLAGKT